MPELPEVEVVRAGLAPAITGARVSAVAVFDPRALKRHTPLGLADDGEGGHGRTLSEAAGQRRTADFERRLSGRVLAAPLRRGKFLWIPIQRASEDEPPITLLAHLGMSGQLLLRTTDAPDDRHVRIRLWLEHPELGELRVDFADQRLFGSLALDTLVSSRGADRVDPTVSESVSESPVGLARAVDTTDLIPAQASHIARDPLDPQFDDAGFVARVRSRGIGVKKLLLDQALVSGVGNIYADEALWRARIHPETPGSALSARKTQALLGQLREVFAQALAEGGTSFDAQYVNVNGQAGYFAHSLNVYGRGGEQCPRCGTPIRRVPFGGRSSHFCPRCQRRVPDLRV